MQLENSLEGNQVQVDGLPLRSLADKILLRKNGESEEDESGPICTGFVTVSRFSGLSESTRQSSSKLEVHLKSSEPSPHQWLGWMGTPAMRICLFLIGYWCGVILFPIPKYCQINRTRGRVVDGLQVMLARASPTDSLRRVQMPLVWKCGRTDPNSIATAASVPAITAPATALLVPTCTPTSLTDTNKSIKHVSTGYSASRSTDTLHATQPTPLLTAASGGRASRDSAQKRKRKVGKASVQERAD